MKRSFSPKRIRVGMRSHGRGLSRNSQKVFAIVAVLFVVVFYQNCANPTSGGSGSAATLQAQIITEPITLPTVGQALGLHDLSSLKSVEYSAPAGGFARPGLNIDNVRILATFNGTSLLPIRISWDIVDFDQTESQCYVFVNPLDIHPDFINVLLQKMAATSLNRVRMPAGVAMSCLDCKSEPLLRLTLNDTTTHSYLFEHQNLDSTPVTEINDPQGVLESTMSQLITFANDVTNANNPNNHCSPP